MKMNIVILNSIRMFAMSFLSKIFMEREVEVRIMAFIRGGEHELKL